MTPRVTKNTVVRHLENILIFILAPPIKNGWIKRSIGITFPHLLSPKNNCVLLSV
jgi:hypothetical protein